MKQVQQAGVIGIADILGVQLPVGPNKLPRVAQDLDWTAKQAVEPGPHVRTRVVFERVQLGRERNKNQPLIRVDIQLVERMLAGGKVSFIAALPFDSFPERDADQVAFQVRTPPMLHTRMGHPVAA